MKKNNSILVMALGLIVFAITTAWLIGCETSNDASGINMPTNSTTVIKEDYVSLSESYQLDRYQSLSSIYNFAGFDVASCSDPYLLVQYFGWQHRDMMNWLLGNYKTVAELQQVATQMPGLYFDAEMPDHTGWPFDSTDYATASISDIEFWAGECIKVGIISPTFTNSLVQTLEQVVEYYQQQNYNLSDQIVNNFVNQCNTYTEFELAVTGVLLDSYTYETSLFKAGYQSPPQVPSWVILVDLLGAIGGGYLTKTCEDGTAGAALCSSAYETIKGWF